MNNKYAPYILGPVLILVWSLVFYKIYQAVMGEEDYALPPAPNYLPIAQDSAPKQSFALLLDYRDPFLGKKFAATTTTNKNTTPTNSPLNRPTRGKVSKTPQNIRNNIPKPPTNKQVKFPKIVYQGFQIVDQDTVALLKINNQFVANARQGQQLGTVTILGIYADSIRVEYKGNVQAVGRVVF